MGEKTLLRQNLICQEIGLRILLAPAHWSATGQPCDEVHQHYKAIVIPIMCVCALSNRAAYVFWYGQRDHRNAGMVWTDDFRRESRRWFQRLFRFRTVVSSTYFAWTIEIALLPSNVSAYSETTNSHRNLCKTTPR